MENEARILEDLSVEDTRQTFHDLRVHQIELEKQNEELRRVQAELQAVITEGKRMEVYKEMGREILHLLSEDGDLKNCMQRVLTALKTRTGFDAVGLRLQVGDDFPYFHQIGFPEDFLVTENTLIERAMDGGLCRDSTGNILLECTCGLVISGKTDLAHPFFTPWGSYWTNDSLPLLDIPPDADLRYHPRNRCVRLGYASVALVPIRNKRRILGLIQLNDHRKGCFFPAAIEQFEDIAKNIGEALRRKQEEFELQKLQKLQAIGTLAGGIAHDFNNILMGMFGYISLAKDELANDHPGYTFLVEAEKSMERAIRLTKQLLTFSKGGAPVKEDVNLGALVENIARSELSGSNVQLVCQQVDDLWMADVDKEQIQQVISILTINARQAMPDGGCLYITLENSEIPEANIGSLPQGKYIKVIVRDEGIGIDQKFLDRIFEPYFAAKKSGNGLGLATVYSIINKHGGHIDIVSELGKGTFFTLYLPASKALQRAEAKPPVVERPPSARPARVLVMDDEDAIRDIVARMLVRCGYSAATAPGGQEAIEMYRQAQAAGAPFDVVIMDLTIPAGIGGKEAIKNLLAIDPQARVIVSSGYADDPVMANYAEYGFKGVAEKPYTQNELQGVLMQVLKG